MCNIAGYAGTKPAAPILIEMMKKQEGMLGGYYTGIATVHEGKIYYAKLTGDVDRLVALTNALSLPGTVGIIHSRSKSGGGDKWAHPFVGRSPDGSEPKIAYVANGASGFFNRSEDKENALFITESLIKDGYGFDSRDVVEGDRYINLLDGTSLHMSDVMCQLIAKYHDSGEPIERAAGNAFIERPSEIVGLLLSLEKPNAISYARFNMPMFVSFASHGAYLSSAPFAMPADRGEHTLLPAGSYGNIYSDHFESYKMKTLPHPIAHNDATLRHDIYDIVEKKLSEGAFEMREINKAAKEAYKGDSLKTVASVTYDVLDQLIKEDRLNIEVRRVEGAFPELTAPKCYMSLK